MKTLSGFIFFILTQTTHANEIVLSLGEAKLLPLQSTQVWVQDREILNAEVTGSQLKIFGKKEGATNVKIGNIFYDVQVVHPIKKQHFESFKSIIKSCVGLHSSVQEGQIVVSGTLYKISDWLKISDFAQKNKFSYSLQASMADTLKKQIQDYLSGHFEKTHSQPQNVIFEPRLEVRAKASEPGFPAQKKMLGFFGVTTVNDDSSLNIAPTIKVEITVAEVKKDKSLKYGIKWPATYDATILNGNVFQMNELAMSLAALEHDGTAKILASPNIIARSGEQAEFVAGGEFPIKIVNYKMQDIIWKKYGVLLRVKPKADSSGRMSISIETEVSTIDNARSVDGIPGLLTNRVSSHFDLSKPQVIALSGLLKNEKGKSTDGLPGLSRLPILGALFSSKDFSENRSELVIFVRPSILSEKEAQDASLAHLKGQ